MTVAMLYVIKQYFMKLSKSTFLLLFTSGVLIFSCNKNEVDPGTAPELPPVASMSMDFSYFGGENVGGRLATTSNWQRAASLVGFWNGILAVNLALPVKAFQVAVSQAPSYDKDRGLWVWDYTYNFVGKQYTSELTGELKDSQVEWKMYISEQGGFQHALWYTGVMDADGSTGYWVLNYNGDNPTEYLRIDWNKTNEEIGNIKFTYTLNGAAEYGSYIEFTTSTGTNFDRNYVIYLSNYNITVDIEWSTVNGNGHIMDPYYYQDEVYHCWDADFMDVNC